MKKYIGILLTALLFASCDKFEPNQNEVRNPGIYTFSLEFPSMDNTKVSVDADGKTQWEVGDQIVFSGRPTAKVVHTLTAEELTNPRLAKITVDLSPLTTEDESTPHKWNVAYPAEIWSPYSSSHMYGRSRFEGTNRLLLAGYVSDDMTSIVMNHVTASILFKVSGDFDSYIFFGNGGTEVLGYEKYLVEINSSSPSYLAKLGATTYGTLDPVTKLTGSVIADGSTVNAIYIQNEADLSSGFTIQFLESGVIKKVISTNTPLKLTHGHAVNLGALPAAALKDYEAPTAHPNKIGVDVATATDLSASETANCYIVDGSTVAPGAQFKFKANKGKGGALIKDFNTSEEDDVVVLWETQNTATAPSAGSIIAAVDYDKAADGDAYIVFKMPDSITPGNALIAAKDAAGKILWSWHIWIPETVISTNTYGDIMGAVAMDRNLGALVAATAGTSPVDVTSFGLLYQWGRKDPFPGAASLASSPSSAALAGGSITKATGVITLEESIANPTLMGYTANGDWIDVSDDNLWKNAEKTIYDPCPAGYRVPARDNSKDFWSSDLSAKTGWTEDGTNGWFTLGNPVAVFPFAGYIDDDGLSYKYAGSRAMYWTSHRSGSVTSYGADIRAGSRHQLSSPARSRAGSVRCVAE